MRRALLTTALGLLCAPGLADPELPPVRGMRYATYDLATGQTRPTAGPVRYGNTLWSAKVGAGYYAYITDDKWIVLDWGDIEGLAGGPAHVGAFAFSYATQEKLPTRIDATLFFFAEENGHNSSGRVRVAGFHLTDLPTGTPDSNSWTLTVDLDAEFQDFTIDGSDLDHDGLIDFGYTYGFPFDILPTGPTIAGDPNVEGPGMDRAFESFSDPNMAPDSYIGYWWFSSIFGQFYIELFDSELPDCPNPGASGSYCTADLDGSGDCLVDLADLARFLSVYGGLDHPRWANLDGDNDVDLADLAELLSQYGDDCN